MTGGNFTCGLRGSKPLKSSFGIKEVMTCVKKNLVSLKISQIAYIVLLKQNYNVCVFTINFYIK